MIVIEGTDFVGKTTLATRITKEMNQAALGPYVYRWLTKLPDIFDEFWHYLHMFDRYAVMDRFYMSRQAYGAVFKNQRLLTPETYRLLDGYLRLVGGVTVLVTASDEWLQRRREAYAKTEQMYDFDGIVRVNAEYMKLTYADVDVRIHLEHEGQWPTDRIEDIKTLHNLRQIAIMGALTSRRQHGNLIESLLGKT